jgi:hypothetical protein
MGQWAGHACFSRDDERQVLHVLTAEVEDTGKGQALCGIASSTWECAGDPVDAVGTPCAACLAARIERTRIVLVPADDWNALIRDLAGAPEPGKPADDASSVAPSHRPARTRETEDQVADSRPRSSRVLAKEGRGRAGRARTGPVSPRLDRRVTATEAGTVERSPATACCG